MGMYTELCYNVRLKEDTPEKVIKTLFYLIGKGDSLNTDTAFINLTDRIRYMLQCDSYYFDADTYSSLRYDDIVETYYFNVHCNLKNYDDEIDKFVDWLDPWVDAFAGDFLGFSRYEENQEPKIIRKGAE